MVMDSKKILQLCNNIFYTSYFFAARTKIINICYCFKKKFLSLSCLFYSIIFAHFFLKVPNSAMTFYCTSVILYLFDCI